MIGYPHLDFHWSITVCRSMSNRVPCFCYEGLPLVAFWRFYCINLVYELISPLIDNTVHQATQLFIILLKTKKLKIVEDDIFNVFVLFTISNQPEFRDLNSQPLLDRETTKTNKKVAKLKTFCLRVCTSWRWSETSGFWLVGQNLHFDT